MVNNKFAGLYERLSEHLPVCCVCNSIRVDDSLDLWLYKKDFPEIHEILFNAYDGKGSHGKRSHGYCPPCEMDALKKIDEFFT